MSAVKYTKPLPVIDIESQEYWESLNRHQLILRRCCVCKKTHFYPRSFCPHCHSDSVDWIDASGMGIIYTYTVARRGAGPAFKNDAPYVVAIIELDEGPRMMTNLVTEDISAVRVGQRVRIFFDDVTDDVTLPKFTIHREL